jgi:hypothetical protein
MELEPIEADTAVELYLARRETERATATRENRFNPVLGFLAVARAGPPRGIPADLL